MILTHPGLTKLTFMDYLLTMLRILLRRKQGYDSFASCARPLWSLTVILAFAPALSTREGRSCVVCYAAEPSRQARASRGCVMSLRCSRTHDPRVECRVLAARAACSERITNTIVARARAELGSILDSGYDLRCYEHVVAVFFRLV